MLRQAVENDEHENNTDKRQPRHGRSVMNIGELLLDRGLVDADQLAKALELRNAQGLRLDRALIQLGVIDEEALLRTASEQLHIEMIDLTGITLDSQTIQSLPAKIVYRKRIVPIRRKADTLIVATSDPFDLYSIDELRLTTDLNIQPALATEDEINKVISTYYGVGADTIDELIDGDQAADATAPEDEDLIDQAQEASVIRLVNEIFIEAIKERASDIHIEPYENDLIVRYRIDGVLHNANVNPEIRRFQSAIISRIKIMAHLNIAERRRPQDGRIKFQFAGKQIDLRVSIIPMLFGEGVVMRVLDKSTVLFTLPQLGMAEDTYKIFQKQIEKPHGIILVTGPTGSGKTTTLYAALSAIVSEQVKVLTVEDPIEYHLDGVNQIQTQSKVGLTFAAGLRAILRHDPDVVMIGEIRDLETAEAAIQAALTGHLVFSTLHTNDACSAATRLIDMGVEPFLVTSTLNAAMAQRLVRTICPACRTDYPADPADLPEDAPVRQGDPLYRGEGCRRCRGTGYRGRTGLYELMVADNAVRALILERASAQQITEAAVNAGLRLLRADGWLKVKQGITTPQEITRLTKA